MPQVRREEFLPYCLPWVVDRIGSWSAGSYCAAGHRSRTCLFAVVGMAAYFTVIVRAPLTGIVLIVEMTGNYNQMLPLLVGCFCAYVVAEYLKDLPIYEALLERDLSRDGSHVSPKEPMVTDLIVEADSPFAGHLVRSWVPAGCVLIRCLENGHEFVPTALTRLQPHMRIMAVIAPQATNGLSALRKGCKAKG